ncbi:MAG: hypothetical protein HC897_01185 [Thermoanaerobaculia bacterium]|nr:hypothetical protein [Thermoanaerobaculia bacterium]
MRIAGSLAIVEFPNGFERRFELVSTTGQWRWSSDRDVFGNFLSADYGTPSQWVLSDSHGRVHRIFLRSDPAGFYGQIVDRIELAAFGGGTATYLFSYEAANVYRPAQDDDPLTSAQVAVPLLTSLSYPDGTTTAFTYSLPRDQGTIDAGRMIRHRLVSGGSIEYTYQNVTFPHLEGALYAADGVGLATRRTFGLESAQEGPPGGPAPLGTWTFTTQLDIPRVVGNLDQPRELTTTITYPDGHYREHKFSVYVSGEASNGLNPPSYFEPADYGLPATKIGKIATNPFHTSEIVYRSNGEKLRTRYLHHEKSSCTGCWDVNARVSRIRTKLHDDGGRTETRELSSFDGLGHYRNVVEFDNPASAPMRTRFTNFSATVPGPSQPWILGISSKTTTTQGSETRTQESCFDPSTGLLLRQRIRTGGSRAANDLLHVFSHTNAGDLQLTRHYGGDVQALDTDPNLDLCALPLPAQEQFATYQTYQQGGLSERGWLASDGSVFLRTYSATIDPATGLTITTAGGDDFTWTHNYDVLGRKLSSTPPAGHGGRQVFSYSAAVISGPVPSPARNEVTTFEADGSVLNGTRTTFDYLGRVSKVARYTLNGWVEGVLNYDAMGRSFRQTTATGAETIELDFDPLGRPGRRRPPEGAYHDRVFSYAGRKNSETVKIGKQWNPSTQSVVEIDRTTTATHDRNGRLIEKLITDSDGDWLRETYVVNLDGEIVSSTATDGVHTATWMQPDRTDGRGFTSEDPEGDPIVGYDALGNLTIRDFGQGSIYHVFDRAGRLIEQREGSASGLLWTRNVYATSNGSGDYRKGKLVESLRINRGVPHLPEGTVWVTELYAYEGQGGSRSKVTTSLAAGASGAMPLFSFEATVDRNGAGQPVQNRFPDCLSAANNAFSQCVPLATRTLDFDYALGSLIGVTEHWGAASAEWIDQVSYDLDGNVIGRVLANGWVETNTPHASGGGRLARMTLSHPTFSRFYDSGLAQYDGLGKLVQLGQQRRVSEHAYALEVSPPPADAGTPGTISFEPHRDALGQRLWREYRVPRRFQAYGSAWEMVQEIYVYAPGNRLLWTRRFNDYDAVYFGYSKDQWHLTDAEGLPVRKRHGLSLYGGSPTFSGAVLSEVQMTQGGSEAVDQMFVGGKRIGTADNHALQPKRRFFHYDIHGRLFATSDESGNIEANLAPAQ